MTNYSIEVKKKAQKYLSTIPKKDRLRIVGAIELLRENPLPPKSLKLKGRDGYRIRIGEYRIIYSFNSKRITIHLVPQLLTESSDLPGSSNEQFSSATCLVLLQVGFT